ncbi:MAG: hypothetical protein KAG34_07115 [Cocleimonas sp.]|nr:hypothetical protein [Cocleimonas sp.]
MKKLPLALTMVSLFAASSSFAVTSSDEIMPPMPPANLTQIFTQNFDVAVIKEPNIVIDPPAHEMIEISTEKLEGLMESGENLPIGSMRVKTTSNNCYAKVSTANDFKLKGILGSSENGVSPILAVYGLVYKVNNMTTTSTGDILPQNTYAKFSSNQDEIQKVGCNTADLAMHFFKYNENAPSDIYTDVITVKVTAES